MYKSKLQEICVVKSWTFPKYSATKNGPDHNPRFTATVFVNGVSFGSPTSCKTVKEAQNKAAEAALIHFISLSSTRVPYSPSPDDSKMEKTSKNMLNAGDEEVPKKKSELKKKQEENESTTLVKSCNLKNSISVANPQERDIEAEAAKIDMNSLSLNEPPQDFGPKLAEGVASVSKQNGKINPTKLDGSPSTKGKGKLTSSKSNAPIETSIGLEKHEDPEPSSFLLCNRVRVYSYIPDIANLPKGTTLLQICDNKWVAVTLDYPKEKA